MTFDGLSHLISIPCFLMDLKVFPRIIIIMAGMAVFNVAGYLIEERRRWPIITASPRGQGSK